MNKQPTQEQIKEFWEWCGLVWLWPHSPGCHCGALDNEDSYRSWYMRKGDDYSLATRYYHEQMVIDLNNLFKYAVPKLPYVVLENCQAGYRASVSVNMKDNSVVFNQDPALTLFWAIWGAMHQ